MLRDEIARLRAEIAGLESRLNKVESAEATVTQATPALTPAPSVPVQQAAAKPTETRIDWKGAPQFSKGEGLTYKPRGRLQFDTNSVSRPAGVTAPTLGWSADVRRAYLGVDGTLGGGLGYRFEVDFAGGNAQFTDAWLTYDAGPVTVTLGHHRLTTLEDLTSDLETTMLERAGFTQAFGFERRLGLSASYKKGDILIAAGVFSDDLETLGSGITANSYALDTRMVFMPKWAGTQFHFSGSLHYRALNDLPPALRYRARPGARTTDVRFVDTGLFSASTETGFGLEFAAVRGPVHVAAESFWQRVGRPGLNDPTFFGSYGEIGYVFAGAKGRGYRDGSFSSIRPTRGIDKGGAGAWQINLRYDWLDLNDQTVFGGRQSSLGTSLIWVPIEHVKFMANYLHVQVSDTPVLAGSRGDYSTNIIGLRAQYDF